MTGGWQESVGNSNTLLTPGSPLFEDRQGALTGTLGFLTSGLGTHQSVSGH